MRTRISINVNYMRIHDQGSFLPFFYHYVMLCLWVVPTLYWSSIFGCACVYECLSAMSEIVFWHLIVDCGMHYMKWWRLSGPWRGPLMANSIVTKKVVSRKSTIQTHTHTGHHLNRFFPSDWSQQQKNNSIQLFTWFQFFSFFFSKHCMHVNVSECMCAMCAYDEFQQCNREKKKKNI